MKFSISDKVVCVDTKPRSTSARLAGIPYPIEGQTYVVRDVWAHHRASEGWLLEIVGFPESYTSDGVRMGWTPSRFRKLDDIRAERSQKMAADQGAFFCAKNGIGVSPMRQSGRPL